MKTLNIIINVYLLIMLTVLSYVKKIIIFTRQRAFKIITQIIS